jgi:hypothetical protein
LVDSTEARVAPGSCTLRCSQLEKCTQGVQLDIGPSKVCAQVSRKHIWLCKAVIFARSANLAFFIASI